MPIINCTFSSPFQPNEMDLGTIESEKMLSYFLNYPWEDWLSRMEGVKEEDIHFSPTLNFEDREAKQKLLVSAVEDRSNIVFYVFYQRPKTVNQFFGLWQKYKEDHTSEVLDQTKEQAALLIDAFAKRNTQYLEEVIKY